MPLTLSHPAAVLPLRGIGLPVTAMVFGSMVPDVPVFVPWPHGYHLTHSVTGVVTVDVVLTLVVVGLWFGVVRDVLVDLSPGVVRSRLVAHVSLPLRRWLLMPVAAVLGALTHIGWDGFTHQGRWGVDRVAWLQAEHAGLPGYKWSQYASGLLGLAIVCWSALSYLRAQPVVRGVAPRSAWASSVLPAVVGIAGAVGLVTAASRASAGFHAMAFTGVVSAGLAGVVGSAIVCLAWRTST